MGLIKYNTVDFNLVPTPEVGTVFTGYDSNTGKLTQKDSNGVVLVIGMSADPEFNSVTLTKDFILGPIVNFVHPSNTNVTDIIGSGVRITRGTSGWLFNPLNEGSHGSTTPSGTEWYYISSPIDFATVDTLTYDYLETVVINNLGSFNALPTTQWVMHDTINDKYYYITFITWQSGGGGGAFSYNRQLITLVGTGQLVFSDGTILTTAPVDVPIISPQKSYVTTLGNDSTAVNYSVKQPYATVSAAVNAAVYGDTVNVGPGDHFINSNIYKDGVTIYAEAGARFLISSTINVGSNGTFVMRGNATIINYTTAFAIPSLDQGYIDVEVDKITSFDAIVFSFGEGLIKIKANDITQNASNGAILFGPTQLDLTAKSYINTGSHACIFVYNDTAPGSANYFYNFKIDKLINSSMNYGALHFETTHETCFVNWTGDIQQASGGVGGFMNGGLTGSGTNGAHGAIIRFKGNIVSDGYAVILSGAGLRVDFVGDISGTGTRPPVTIAGNNRPTLQLRGNISGIANDLIHMGIVDVFTQNISEGFFKHISGKLIQNSLTGNSVIIKEGPSTELVIGGELMTMNPAGYAIYTTTLQDVYCLNASTNGTLSVGVTTFGTLNTVTGVPEIDF